MVTLTKHVFSGPNLHSARPLALRDLLQYLHAKCKRRPKKSYYLSARPWHCPVWQIRCWLLHYVHKKFTWGPEVATLRTKTLDSSLVMRFNWWEKIKLRGCAGPPGRQYYLMLITVVHTCTVVRKDAKSNWKWRNKVFLVNFCHWRRFNWRRPGPLGHPLGYAYDFEIRSCP